MTHGFFSRGDLDGIDPEEFLKSLQEAIRKQKEDIVKEKAYEKAAEVRDKEKAVQAMVEAINKTPWPKNTETGEPLIKATGYFTPDIQDIYIGYECETQVDPYPDWIRSVIEDGEELQFVMDKVWDIRTPFLTKEQIEKEGWEYCCDGGMGPHWIKNLKDNPFAGRNHHTLIELHYPYLGNTDMLYIYDKSTLSPLFRGQCKDINTFRKICKLIGI